jgi:protein SCO1
MFPKAWKLLQVAASTLLLATSAWAGSPWGEDYFPNLQVVDQNGRRLEFFDDVLKGQQLVISFIFTSCQDLCPLSTARLRLVEEELKKHNANVRFVALSVDPKNDTPERMKAFAEAFGAENWLFLTGTRENMSMINGKLGNRSEKPSEHRNEIVLGNESTGEWARNSAFIETDRLVIDVLQLDPVWRNTARSVKSDDQQNQAVVLSDRPGEALFRKVCTPCHTIGVGDRVGPDLMDVTQRRSAKWLRAFIADPAAMQRKGDKIALALDKRFPSVVMPAMGLAEGDTQDLVDYLKSASDQIHVGGSTEHVHADGSAHKH